MDMLIMAHCINVMDTNIWQSRIQYIKYSLFSLEVCCTLCTFPIVVIFFRGCMSEMFVPSYSVIYYIHIPGTLGPCFHYWCSVYGICKWSDTLWPVGRVRLFADCTISLSSLCRLIWRHWTTKMLVRYMLSSVCLRFRQFSQLSFIQYMGLCVFSLPNSPVMIVRMCALSYYHHQIGSINHCLGLGHETMVCAVCLTMFLCIEPVQMYCRLIAFYIQL